MAISKKNVIPQDDHEKIECDICMENYTAVKRKKCKCDFCGYESCRACIQQNFLEHPLGLNCTNCGETFDENWLHANIPSHFFKRRLPKAQKEKLFSTEEYNIAKIKRLLKIRDHVPDILGKLKSRIEILDREKKLLEFHYQHLKRQDADFLNGDLYQNADIIEQHMAQFIFEESGGIKVVTSDQNPFYKKPGQEEIQEKKLEKLGAKPCPSCGIHLQKEDGCLNMWCPMCHLAFNWNTLNVTRSVKVDNPHYDDWVLNQERNVSRERPCKLPNKTKYFKAISKFNHNSQALWKDLWYKTVKIYYIELKKFREKHYETHRDCIFAKYIKGDIDLNVCKEQLYQTYRTNKFYPIYRKFLSMIGETFIFYMKNIIDFCERNQPEDFEKELEKELDKFKRQAEKWIEIICHCYNSTIKIF